jgi:predicted permease
MSLWSRLVNVIRGDRLIGEIDEELASHLAEATAQGRDPVEARRALGSALGHREASRDVRRLVWLGDFLMDLRYAVRTLWRHPGFLAAAVLSLGLGLGANTAIFSLIDAVMLRAMPVVEPQRLVQVTKSYADGQTGGSFSFPLFEYLRDGDQAFSGLFAQTNGTNGVDIDFHGATDRVTAALVSGSYYAVLGLTPVAGRLLAAEDDEPGMAGVAVMSDRYWQRHFARDPSAVGATFALNGATITIVGVAPPEFFGTLPGSDPDLTFPLSMVRFVRGWDNSWRQRDAYNFLAVMARLKPSTTADYAAAQIRTKFASRVQAQASRSRNPNDQKRILSQRLGLVSAQSGFNRLRAQFSEPLLILMAIAGLVLLLACANLSSLFLARAAVRRREILVRCAIGAGRGRLMRQFLTESLVLAVLGSAAGVALAVWSRAALIAMMANGGTLILPMTPDWRVFAFTCGITLATCLLVGLVPSLHAARSDISLGLRDARGGTRHRLGRSLVIGQIAISLFLLIGATLFVGTLVKLYSIDPGFRRDGILTFGLDTKELPGSAHRQAVESELRDRINRLPGVASTSAVEILFMSGGGSNGAVSVEGYLPATNEEPMADFNSVAPGFFNTMGTPLVAGRDFDGRDAQPPAATTKNPMAAGLVAIINESFAKAYFPGRSPLGRHLTIAGAVDQYEIVGVAKDAKYFNLEEAFPKTVYFALSQQRQPGKPTLLVHTTASDPSWVVPQVETLLRNIDPVMHLLDVRTFAEQVGRTILNERIMATLGAFFGLLALVVACLGIFGVMAFQVAQRTREFGIRIALGATRRRVTVLVLRDVSVMLLVGSAIGATTAAGLAHTVKGLLFGVTPTDPTVFLFAIAFLGVASFCAGQIPARRAARVDPIVALRNE